MLILENLVQNYNQTRHEFEIHLENASQVEPCPEEAEEIPQIQYHVRALFCLSQLLTALPKHAG